MRLNLTKTVAKGIKRPITHMTFVFIERTRIVIVQLPDQLQYVYEFPKTAVADGDVINKGQLQGDLVQWLSQASLKMYPIHAIVAPDLIFEKDFLYDMRRIQSHEDEIRNFCELVPYQHIVSARFIDDKQAKTKIYVANRELLSTLTHVFEEVGFEHIAFYPAQIFPLTDTLEDEYVRRAQRISTVLSRPDSHLTTFLFGKPPTRSIATLSVAEAAQIQVQPILALGIIVSVVILGVAAVYWQFNQARIAQQRLAQARMLAQTVSQKTIPPPVEVVAAPTEAEVVATDEAQTRQDDKQRTILLRAQILFSPQTRDLSLQLKEELEKEYQATVVLEEAKTNEVRNAALFATGVDEVTQGKITNTLRKVGISPVVRSASIIGFDLVLQITNFSPSAPSITTIP
jgi:hypothetical protein